MEHCADQHEAGDGLDVCVFGHPLQGDAYAETDVSPHWEMVEAMSAKAEPTDDPGEASYAEPVWKDRVHVEAEHVNEGITMGDNISTPTIQGLGGWGGFGGNFHWKDRDGLEGKDAVLIHALHDGRDHKDTLREVLGGKFDVVSAIDERIDRLRDRVEDKFDKLDCKVERKFERVDDKLEEFERRQVARVIKEQDDKIQELKLKLLLCEKLPVPPVPPVPAP